MERIGRYTIDRLLARGGMAEVYLGRAEGPGGFSKRVVIKRILPERAKDALFVEMFLDEARLAALLSHPNIAQVFDFGEHEGAYFLAMEYVEGETARALIKHFALLGLAVPPGIAAKLASSICEGLHYAHELKDEHGISRNIVHRDVTPDNVLLSAGGIPKLVDFGIAKARGVSRQMTQVGELKGKYAYLAPEQLRSEAVDRRVDVYALGVTLYEMLVGFRPFTAQGPMLLVRQILAGGAPPASEMNPAVPEALSRVVDRALSATKADRYPDCQAFQADLEEFLESQEERTTAADFSALVADVARARRGKGRHPGSGPDAAARKTDAVEAVAGGPGDETVISLEHSDAMLEWVEESPTDWREASRTEGDEESRFSVAIDRVRELLRDRAWILAAAAMALAVGIGLLLMRGPAEKAAGPARTVAPVAAVPVAPAPVATEPAAAVPDSLDSAEHLEEVFVPERRGLARGSTVVAAGAPVPAPDPNPPAPRAGVARATTLADEPGPVPAAGGARTPSAPAAEAASRSPVAVEGAGFLSLRSDPWCEVFLDGARWGTTPMTQERVAAGRHVVILRNDALGLSRRIQVTVEAGKETKESVLFPKGTLVLKVSPWAKVYLDGEVVGTTPMEPLGVLEGKHQLRLVNPDLGKDEARTLQIRAGREETVKVIWE